jgi:hypothetical protein
MEEEQKFTQVIIRNVKPDELKRLYERLENEHEPHSLTVHEGLLGLRKIELWTTEEKVSYFDQILFSVSDEMFNAGKDWRR